MLDPSSAEMPVRVGDPVQRVQQIYDLRDLPTRNSSSSASYDASYHLSNRGLWFFFKEGKVQTIRIEAPFAGAVDGIRIGDPKSKLLRLKGKPKRAPWEFGGNDAYAYGEGASFVRYDVSRSTDKVETIFR